MKFTLEIKLGNDAMQTGSDVASALRGIANRIESEDEMVEDRGKILDFNGNTVGKWVAE